MLAPLHVATLSVVFWQVYRHEGGAFTLGTLYAARWAVLIGAYAVSPISYNDIGLDTWAVLYGSLVGVLAAYWAGRRRGVATVASIGNTKGYVNLPTPKPLGVWGARYLKLWIFGLSIIGFSLLAYYIVSVAETYGLDSLIHERASIRLAIRRDGPLPGFHYFYFLEIIPALCIALRIGAADCLTRRTDVALMAIALLSFLGLFAKTGRSNIGKAVILAFFLWLASKYVAPNWKKVMALLVPIIVVLGSVLIGLGIARGESFDKEPMNTVVEEPGVLGAPLLVYHRYAAPVPTLDKVLDDDELQRTWGALTVRPVLQFMGRIYPEYEPPSHIGKFYRTPYEFNVATQLDVMYKDFGWAGLLIGPVVFGFVMGRLQAWREKSPSSSLPRFMWVLGMMAVWASPAVAVFVKMNYFVQAIVLIVIGRGLDRRGRREQEAPTAIRS